MSSVAPCEFAANPFARSGYMPEPRNPTKWATAGRVLLRIVARVAADNRDTMRIVLRRGSLLEAVRGFRGDDDVDMRVFLGPGLGVGAFAHAVRAAMAAMTAEGDDLLGASLASGWPWSWLYFDRCDTPVLWCGRASIDFEVLAWSLIHDSSYTASVRARMGGWAPVDLIRAPMCACFLPDIDPNVALLCPAVHQTETELTLAYGPDFRELKPGKELDFELISRRLIISIPPGSWIFDRITA